MTVTADAIVIGAGVIGAAAALSMITKKNLPMRAIFFRDHEIRGLGAAWGRRRQPLSGPR